MSGLHGAALVGFEAHLLQCAECQDAVDRMALFLAAVHATAEPPQPWERAASEAPAPARSRRECFLVQAALPNQGIQNIGILLLDACADRLYCRFRRDFESVAGDEAHWLRHLGTFFSGKADELGGWRCLEWCKATFAGMVRISRPRRIRMKDYAATTLDGLYAKYIRANVLAFRTHLPQYNLDAAAGKFGRQMLVEPEGWVEVRTDIPLTEDMFVVHVTGHSMEPQIPDDSLCAFRSRIAGPAAGKVLLIEQYAESGGSRYTVKLYRVSEAADPNERGDGAWLHERLTLESINPGFASWDVASAVGIRILGEFLFVV